MLLVAIAAGAPAIVSAFGGGGPSVRHPGAVSALGVASGPSSAHPFGVDELGRDVLARVVYGFRTALFVALVGTLIAASVALLVGFVARHVPPVLRGALQCVVEALAAFPVVILGLAVGTSCDSGGCGAGAISPGVSTVVFVVALCGFGPVGRAAVRGASWRSPAAAALRFVPAAVLLEAALGFLGAGVRGATPDWGQMLAGAEHALVNGDPAWWLLLFPGVALIVTVIAWLAFACGVGGPPATVGGRRLRRVWSLAQLPPVALIAFVLFWVLPARRGASMFGHSALGAIWSHLSGTVSVLAGVVVLWLVLGPMLSLAASRRRSRPVRAAAFVLSCAPVFWLGLIAVWLFASDVGQLPALPGVGRYVGLTAAPVKWLGSLVLPWIALGLWWTARGALAVRPEAAQVLNADFIRLARAKGLSGARVFWLHVWPAAASSSIRWAARDLGLLLGGALLIEVVLKIGGVGLLAADSARVGAVATAQWVAVLAAVLVVVVRGWEGIRS